MFMVQFLLEKINEAEIMLISRSILRHRNVVVNECKNTFCLGTAILKRIYTENSRILNNLCALFVQARKRYINDNRLQQFYLCIRFFLQVWSEKGNVINKLWQVLVQRQSFVCISIVKYLHILYYTYFMHTYRSTSLLCVLPLQCYNSN